MPNTYIKAEQWVSLALAALYRDSVLPNVVTRYDGRGFIGAKDDRVHYKLKPVTKARDYEWRTRTAPIVVDEIYRTDAEIKLDTHTYSANGITDEELTLDISDFGTEIVLPQLEAVRDRLERKVVSALATAPFGLTNLNAVAADSAFTKALGWSAALTSRGMPLTNRTLVVGSAVYPWIMADPKLIQYDSNQATTAYREAMFGRIAGFDAVQSDLIPATAIYALHPTWAVLANLAPEIPQGVTYGARRTFEGYSLRVIRDYDSNYARDRSLVSTFSGISSINDEFARWAQGDTIPTGYEVGDIKITAGEPVLTGKNVRGAKGVFTP